jgi:hypothetical protein
MQSDYPDLAQMSKDPYYQIWQNMGAALWRNLCSTTVAVVFIENGKQPVISSGTCVQLGGRYFIATCAHAIVDHPNADFMIFLAVRLDDLIQIPVHPLARLSPTPIAGTSFRKDDDVAWIELDAEHAMGLGANFVGPERIEVRRDDVQEDCLGVMGTPERLADPEALAGGVLRLVPLYYHTVALEGAARDAKDVDPTRDHFLAYPKGGNVGQNSDYVELPPAYGLSGAGVWCVHVHHKGVWTPQAAKLTAIQSAWHQDFIWLRTTRIQAWLNMIAEDIPEIAGVVRSVTGAAKPG